MRTGAGRALGAGVLGVVLVGCGSDGGDAAGADPAPAEESAAEQGPPPLTEDEAAEVLERYAEVNNAANADLDGELLATVEGGQLLQRSLAAMERVHLLPEEDRASYGEEFSYEPVDWYLPAGEDWWMATARLQPEREGDLTRLLTFAAEGDEWRLVSSLPLREELPEVALDDAGLATPAAADAPVGDLAPQQIAEAYEDVWSTGGDGLGELLAETGPVEDALDAHGQALSPGLMERFEAAEPDHGQIYGLETVDGGVLAVVPLAQHEISVSLSGEPLTPSEAVAFYDDTPRDRIRSLHVGEAAAHLAPDASARVLAARYQLVDAD